MVKEIVSKQQLARERQNYTPVPVRKTCANCEHYSSIFVEDRWGNPEEKKRRCGIGGFAVKKSGTCREHKFSETIEA